MQPIVKPVIKVVWQPGKCLYTRYNRLSNRLSNRFDNRLYHVYKHSTGCQTRLITGLTTGCIVYTASCQTVVQPGLITGWTNSGCSSTQLWNRFNKRFDNRLYHL